MQKQRTTSKTYSLFRIPLVQILLGFIFALGVIGIFFIVEGSLSANHYEALPAPVFNSTLSKLSSYPQYADDVADISSECVYLLNLDTGKVIIEKNAYESVQVASLTKIMTCIVAIENIKDLEGTTYTFSQSIIDYVTKQGSAVAGFKVGEKVSALDLLYGAMLPSAGDAAMGIANLVSGSQEDFVSLMNQKAKEIGMRYTTFANPTGFDESNNYSNAYDISVLFEYALHNKTFCDIISHSDYTTSKTPEHPKGIYISSTVFAGYENNGIDSSTLMGGKTGFTDGARLCLATYSQIDGNHYMLITLGAGTGSNKPQYHFMDQGKLYSSIVA